MAARKPKIKAKVKPAAKKAAKKTAKTPEIAMRKGPDRTNANSKALFLDHHLPKIARLQELADTAQANLRNGYRTAKADGFLKHDFGTAFRLKTQTGEKEIKANIARDMTIAKWLGYSLGKQLDLFVQADEHDIEAQAYADGEEASRTGKPAAPIYAPETPGFEAYMHGYHDHQEELSKGFKKTEPSSGVSMTRSQFKAQQAAAKRQAAEVMEADEDEPQQSSMFKRRNPEEAAE